MLLFVSKLLPLQNKHVTFMALSPKEVKRSVTNDLKSKSISRAIAADILGMGTQTYANLLSQQKYFSRKMAIRFHEKFGYSIEFLMTGIGDLLPVPELSPEEQRLYDESKEKQQKDEIEYWDKIAYDNSFPPDPTEPLSAEHYANFDIEKGVIDFKWETKNDALQAHELLCAFRYQLEYQKVNSDYLALEARSLKEENTRLRLENMALRRLRQRASKDGNGTQ